MLKLSTSVQLNFNRKIWVIEVGQNNSGKITNVDGVAAFKIISNGFDSAQ